MKKAEAKKYIKKIAGKTESVILSAYVGSISHGTYIPGKIDDIDIMSIVVPRPSFYYGLDSWGSRGTKTSFIDKYDMVFYEFKKFVSLLTKCNPNVLGLLWLKKDLYINLEMEAIELIENRALFSSKIAYKSFCGYAYSQLTKMNKSEFKGYMGEKRKALVRQYGYDTKNAAHLIRLLRMGKEFLETGEVNVYRPKDREYLLQIKTGCFTLEFIKAEAIELFDELKRAVEKSHLPDVPDKKKISDLMTYILNEHFKLY